MLRTRIITAIILGIVLLAALFGLPHNGWMAFVALFIGAAAWEWGGFARLGVSGRVAFVGVVLATYAATLAWTGLAQGRADPTHIRLAYLGAVLIWLFAVPVWLHRLPPHPPVWLVLVTGVLVLMATAVAIVDLRSVGIGQLLAIMSIAWVADVTAYFVGRAFGRRKLAPAISPGKTLEGALGALAGVAIYSAALLLAFDFISAAVPAAVACAVVLGAISILGDLFESALKRQAGLKDSGRLLPGHGGVLDRIDALLPILPLAALILPRA